MIKTHLEQMIFVMLFEYGKKKLLSNYHNQFEDMNEDF